MTTNYIDNKLLHAEMLKYHYAIKEAADLGIQEPIASDYIGDCIFKIAHKYATFWKFNRYSNSWKEEMISDGIENCIKYGLKGFNPEKYKNPLAYFTEIIHWSFIRRIKREKKEQYKKLKGHQEMDLLHKLNSNTYKSNFENEVADTIIADFEKKLVEEKEKRNTKKGIEAFIETDDQK